MMLRNIINECIETYLVESSLNRVLGKHYNSGFIIITSYRGNRTSSDNRKSFTELKNRVKQARYSYIPVYGGFIENAGTEYEAEVREPSLLITNYKAGSVSPKGDSSELLELGIDLCGEFNQESFLYKPQGDSDESYYIDSDSNVTMTFTGKSVNDLTQLYFTDLAKGFNQTSKRFTFTENLYLNNPPVDGNEARQRFGELFINLK